MQMPVNHRVKTGEMVGEEEVELELDPPPLASPYSTHAA
jgi:hypothetical protein